MKIPSITSVVSFAFKHPLAFAAITTSTAVVVYTAASLYFTEQATDEDIPPERSFSPVDNQNPSIEEEKAMTLVQATLAKRSEILPYAPLIIIETTASYHIGLITSIQAPTENKTTNVMNEDTFAGMQFLTTNLPDAGQKLAAARVKLHPYQKSLTDTSQAIAALRQEIEQKSSYSSKQKEVERLQGKMEILLQQKYTIETKVRKQEKIVGKLENVVHDHLERRSHYSTHSSLSNISSSS